MINFDNCRFVIWGFKTYWCDMSQIYEGFYRALQHMGQDVRWLDAGSDVSQEDFSNTFFITEHVAMKADGRAQNPKPMPILDDCFYAVHGLSDDLEDKTNLAGKNYLGWNVFLTRPPGDNSVWPPSYPYYKNMPPEKTVWLDEEAPLYPEDRYMTFRWATDLMPEEIEANKPDRILGQDSRVIHWIGPGPQNYPSRAKAFYDFMRACNENEIEFCLHGGHTNDHTSIADSIRLTRESYMAPDLCAVHQVKEGYATCRLFKNISYGQPVVTNSKFASTLFGGELPWNEDAYQLFFTAQHALQTLDVKTIHRWMDTVAKKHTYLNRVEVLVKAARIIMEKP